MYNFLVLLSGALITIMVSFNSILSDKVGSYTAILIIHIVGFVLLNILILVKKIKIRFTRKIPLIFYSAGVIGIFTVLFNNLTFSALGASLAIALGLFGQTIGSLIIDSFGFMGMKKIKFNNKKIFGLTLITIGIVIMTIY